MNIYYCWTSQLLPHQHQPLFEFKFELMKKPSKSGACTPESLSDMNDWKNAYVELMRRGQIADAIALRVKNTPRSLFRYQSCKKQRLEALECGLVWMGSPDTFNDPFDSNLSISVDEVSNQWLGRLLGSYRNDPRMTLSQTEIDEVLQATDKSARLTEIYCAKQPDERAKSQAALEAMSSQNEMSDALRNLGVEIQRRLKIACFTTNVGSTLLWSHYAAGSAWSIQ